MRISYVINQYPKVSHSFIRREILALEQLGFNVQRIAIRGWADEVVDQGDIDERLKTSYVLKKGAFNLLLAAICLIIAKPPAFFRAFWQAVTVSKKADRAFFYHMIYFFEACYISNLLAQHQSGHMHAHFGTNSAEVAMLASMLSGVPYSFTVHGPEEFDKPRALHLIEKIRMAKFVVAVSSFGRSQLYRWANFEDWKKVKVVHCAVDQSFSAPVSAPFPQKPRLVCVGRLSEQKGHLLLIEALHMLHIRGLDFEFVFAGDGELRKEIERLLKEYGIADKVTISGWLSGEQVKQELLLSQALILPSFAEGLPVVIMEAMALARPVVSTYIAGIPELIIPGKTGWLIPAGSAEGLADVMAEVLTTPRDQLEAYGLAGRKIVLERHDAITEGRKLANLFSS